LPITGFTGTAQLDDQVDTKQVSQRVVETAYARAIVDAFCSALGGHDFINGSNVRGYTRLNKLVATGFTEGVDASPTPLGDTSRAITISEHGVGVDYGDLLDIANSTPQGRDRVRRMMAKAYADRIESLLLGLVTSFTQQVGTTNTPWSEDKFLACINKLEAAEADGPFFAIFHTTQVHNLRLAAGGSTGNQAAVYQREGVLNRIGPAMSNAYVTTQFECDVFKSSNCPVSGTNNVDKVGTMLPMSPEFFPMLRLIGQFPDGSVWDGRYAEERDESGRLTEMWMTGAFGTGLLGLDWGVGAVSVG
jgi:hypothetical protein